MKIRSIINFIKEHIFKSREKKEEPYLEETKVITIKNVKSGELDSSGADTIDDVPKNLPDNCRL